jgi:hypothetical protein
MKKHSAVFSFFGLLVAIVLFGLLSLTSCSSGFGIYEFESDSTYIEITSSDSITHFYKEVLRFDRDMWCFKHAQWEVVEVR